MRFERQKKMAKLSKILCVSHYIEHSSKDGMERRREIKVEKEALMNQCKMLPFKKLHSGKIFSFSLVLKVVYPSRCSSAPNSDSNSA